MLDQVRRVFDAAKKKNEERGELAHFFRCTERGPKNPKVRVHRRSRVAFADCGKCRRSIIALPGQKGVIGSAMDSPCLN